MLVIPKLNDGFGMGFCALLDEELGLKVSI
jgi:hypothetical protein